MFMLKPFQIYLTVIFIATFFLGTLCIFSLFVFASEAIFASGHPRLPKFEYLDSSSFIISLWEMFEKQKSWDELECELLGGRFVSL